jgi:aminoglycoside phosphotransferase (APT) family kinase protein
MAEIRLPTKIDDIDAELIGAALAAGYPGTVVTSLEIGKVIWGTATKVPLRLAYNEAGRAHGLPPTMWLKGPIQSPLYELVASLYTTEVRFYRDLAPHLELGMALPRCYFAGVNSDGSQPTLLLEDLLARPARFPGPEALTVDEVAQFLTVLAALHARRWNSPELRDLPRFAVAAQSPALEHFLTDAMWSKVMDKPHAQPTPNDLRNVAVVRRIITALLNSKDGPRALLHGDPHIGNTFIAPGGPGLLDWQLICEGPALDDVVYFMTTSLDVEDRRKNERNLVTHYLAELSAHGIDSPSFDDAWLDYRKYAIHAWAWIMVPEEQQRQAVCDAISRRGAAAVTDLDTVGAWRDTSAA